jgi:cardiolipin synthase
MLVSFRRRSSKRPALVRAGGGRRRIGRRWRHGIIPDPRLGPQKGAPTLWTRIRRALWAWWLWALVSLAIALADGWERALIAASIALICFVFKPEEAPPQYNLDHSFDAGSDEFLSTISGATAAPFSTGNGIQFLNNGDQFYPAMLRDVATAKQSITMEAYIYWAGDIGLRFARALAEKSRSGVPVKLLLDAVGSTAIGDEVLETLKDGGCHLAWYNPIRWYSLGRFNHRTHRKSLIIDGRVAYTGGAGIADHWMGDAQDADHWRDTQVRIEGPAVVPLQSGFSENWLQTTRELISGFAYYPMHSPAGRVNVQTIMSSPETGASSVRVMYYLSIVAARKSIYIATPYFVPDEVAMRTLIDAKRRRVDVRIMLPGTGNDNWLARRNSVRLYKALLEAGIVILEYNRTMLHQKIMIVDGLWATIGTTNFDNRSFAHNEESNICIHDAQLARELQQTFLADAVFSTPVSLARWRRRGLIPRIGEMAAALFQDQV